MTGPGFLTTLPEGSLQLGLLASSDDQEVCKMSVICRWDDACLPAVDPAGQAVFTEHFGVNMNTHTHTHTHTHTRTRTRTRTHTHARTQAE
jgi:carbohydrate-binding DOMON domain-containing protein